MKWSRVLFVIAIIALADPAAGRDYCCALTEVDKESGRVTAREGAKGRTFDFVVTDAKARKSLRVGQPVDADFKERQAWLPPNKKRYRVLKAVAGSGRKGVEVQLEAVRTKRIVDKLGNEVGVVGGQEGKATVVLSGPAQSVTYDQAGRGTREGPPMVLLISSDPAVLRVPAGVAVPVGEREGEFTFITSAVSQPQNITITATFNDESKTGIVKIVPSRLLRIEMPAPVRGGHVVQGRVVLNGPPANAAGGTVKLASANAQLVKVPSSVTVGTDHTQATFDVETFGVAEDTTVTVEATHGELPPRSASVTLLPPVVAEVDTSQESGSSWCVGPCSRTLRVVLDGKAPAGGLPLTLKSELPVHIQAAATVPAGASEVSVPFTATQVSSNQSATLSASYDGSKKRVTFKVYRLEKHDLYVRRKPEIIDRHGNVVTTPPDSQPFQMCVNVAHKTIAFHTSGYPAPTALGVTYRMGTTGRSFQIPVLWESPVYVDNDDIDILFVRICFDLPGIADGGVMDLETIADVRKELDERDESNNDRSFKIER
jgi:hypothetical protein